MALEEMNIATIHIAKINHNFDRITYLLLLIKISFLSTIFSPTQSYSKIFLSSIIPHPVRASLLCYNPIAHFSHPEFPLPRVINDNRITLPLPSLPMKAPP
jgi:hypothetical protein